MSDCEPHELASDHSEPSSCGLVVDFDRREQAQRLFFTSFLWRWIITLALCGTVAGVVFGYRVRSPTPDREIWLVDSVNFANDPSALSTSQTHWLQTLVTGLQIGISVNIAAALAHFAQKLRWMLLSRTPQAPEIFNLVAACDDTTNVVKLLFKRKARYPLKAFALAWVLLFFAAQIGTATIGLTFEVQSSADISVRRTTEIRPGNITALDIIGPYANRSQGVNNQRKYSNDAFRASLLLTNPGSYLRYYSPPSVNGLVWALNLTNYGTPPQGSGYQSISSTSIGIYSNNGIGYPLNRIIRGNCSCTEHTTQSVTTSDDSSAVTYDNGTGSETRIFPFRADNDTTRVLYLGPASERAVRLLVFWGNNTSNASFICTNQIWQASNYAGMQDGHPIYMAEDDPSRQMPSNIAQIWAGAMTWTSADPADDRQGNAYDNDNIFNEKPDSRTMENTIARKTLLALHIHDLSGPPVAQASLQAVVPSYSVSPKRPYIELNLALITGLHLLLAVSVSLVLCCVPVLDDRPLAMAALLGDAAREVGLGDTPTLTEATRSKAKVSEQEAASSVDLMEKRTGRGSPSGDQRLVYGWCEEEHQRRLVIGSERNHDVHEREKDQGEEAGHRVVLRTRKFASGRYKLW